MVLGFLATLTTEYILRSRIILFYFPNRLLMVPAFLNILGFNQRLGDDKQSAMINFIADVTSYVVYQISSVLVGGPCFAVGLC